MALSLLKEQLEETGLKFRKHRNNSLSFTINEPNDYEKYLYINYDTSTSLMFIQANRSYFKQYSVQVQAVKINTIEELNWLFSNLIFCGNSIKDILNIDT